MRRRLRGFLDLRVLGARCFGAGGHRNVSGAGFGSYVRAIQYPCNAKQCN